MKNILFFALSAFFAVNLLFAQPAITDPHFHRRAGVATGCSTARDSQMGATTVGVILRPNQQTWAATQFTAAGSYTICAINLRLSKTGSPTGNLTAFIYTDASGAPGSLVGTASTAVAENSLPTSEGDVLFSGVSAALTSGTKYWVVIFTSNTSDNSNYTNWNTAGGFGSGQTDGSGNGSSWSSFTSRQGKFTLYSN